MIQIIEADLQLLMRIFLGLRIERKLEKDKRLSKHNHGSRKGYSVESALLEKRLMFDYAKRTEQETGHMVSDLVSCYDRQLPNTWGIVEESIGVNRNMMLLLGKVLPKCNHCIGTAHGISSNYHGGVTEDLGGTGQGNVFSGNACRDVSCLIFKELENEKKGVIIK